MEYIFDRITIDEKICNGEPTLRGKRITVQTINLKTLKNINIEILEAAIRYGFEAHNEKGKKMI